MKPPLPPIEAAPHYARSSRAVMAPRAPAPSRRNTARARHHPNSWTSRPAPRDHRESLRPVLINRQLQVTYSIRVLRDEDCEIFRALRRRTGSSAACLAPSGRHPKKSGSTCPGIIGVLLSPFRPHRPFLLSLFLNHREGHHRPPSFRRRSSCFPPSASRTGPAAPRRQAAGHRIPAPKILFAPACRARTPR